MVRADTPWRIWAIDPGAVYTGVAWLGENHTWSAEQYDNPVEAYAYVVAQVMRYDYFLIEDFSHGGAFTKEAKDTIEVVGLFKYASIYLGLDPIIRHKDKRLSGQREAAKLMGSTVAELKVDEDRKDAFSALSHCITWRREHVAGIQK